MISCSRILKQEFSSCTKIVYLPGAKRSNTDLSSNKPKLGEIAYLITPVPPDAVTIIFPSFAAKHVASVAEEVTVRPSFGSLITIAAESY
ncbi:hypothetical protein D3C80_1161720 [compost metagenome]